MRYSRRTRQWQREMVITALTDLDEASAAQVSEYILDLPRVQAMPSPLGVAQLLKQLRASGVVTCRNESPRVVVWRLQGENNDA
ncbi:MAG: hypothetical protein KGI89_03030 [Euryarchaeota archaeon]|nr:hypothetical protein [Euryarchaeota archaeon]